VLRHMARLWQFDVYLESVDDNGYIVQRYECVAENRYALRS
jgi:spore cortex formation protein SpoVR/YcgB (stage V sporulation)